MRRDATRGGLVFPEEAVEDLILFEERTLDSEVIAKLGRVGLVRTEKVDHFDGAVAVHFVVEALQKRVVGNETTETLRTHETQTHFGVAKRGTLIWGLASHFNVQTHIRDIHHFHDEFAFFRKNILEVLRFIEHFTFKHGFLVNLRFWLIEPRRGGLQKRSPDEFVGRVFSLGFGQVVKFCAR